MDSIWLVMALNGIFTETSPENQISSWSPGDMKAMKKASYWTLTKL